LFFGADESVVEVEPGFELVTNIVVSPDRGNFFAVFQVKIVVGLPTVAKSIGEVGREKGETKSAANGDDEEVVGDGKFGVSGNGLKVSQSAMTRGERVETYKVATRGVHVIIRCVLKLIEEKLFDDEICRTNVFMNERTGIRDRKIVEVKRFQSGVI